MGQRRSGGWGDGGVGGGIGRRGQDSHVSLDSLRARTDEVPPVAREWHVTAGLIVLFFIILSVFFGRPWFPDIPLGAEEWGSGDRAAGAMAGGVVEASAAALGAAASGDLAGVPRVGAARGKLVGIDD